MLAPHNTKNAYTPKGLHRLKSRAEKAADRWKRRKTTDRIPSTKMKHTFRIRAHDQKDRLLFFKVRTKQRVTTIKRFATLRGFKIDRVKH